MQHVLNILSVLGALITLSYLHFTISYINYLINRKKMLSILIMKLNSKISELAKKHQTTPEDIVISFWQGKFYYTVISTGNKFEFNP